MALLTLSSLLPDVLGRIEENVAEWPDLLEPYRRGLSVNG